MTVSSRMVTLFLVLGLLFTGASSLIIAYQLSKSVASGSRDRELGFIFGAIESGPLAISRLQASAIAQQQLSRLMENENLHDRGIVSVEIRGGPDFSFKFAEWKSKEFSHTGCIANFEKTFTFPDAINPFKILVTRDECHQIAESRTILRYSLVATSLSTLIALLVVLTATLPVVTSIQRAERAFATQFKKLEPIPFLPMRSLVRRARRSLELERDQALVTIAAQVSHDIRSPLSALNMIVGTLQEISDEKRSLIHNAMTRINDISNHLLGLKKETALSSPRAIEWSAVEPVLKQIHDEKVLILSARPGIEIVSDFNPEKHHFVPVESGVLARVLSNLVNNSIEAIKDQGKITLALRSSSRSVDIVILDTGKGIPREILKRLSLESLSHDKEQREGGTGLGLSYARSIVESAGGELQIQSKIGVGTQVCITLPLIPGPVFEPTGTTVGIMGLRGGD